MIAEEIISRLEIINKIHYIYRDIKPENFTIGGICDFRLIYMLDFGLAKKFRNLDGSHYKGNKSAGLVG